MVDEGARDGEPLLFAARELVGIALHLVGEADQAKGVRDLAPDLRARRADHLQRIRDVVVDIAVRKQLVVLEDGADPAAELRDLLVREGTDVPSGDQDLTLRRADLADQRLDQGRLAAARRSDEEDELAAVYPQADVLEPDVAPGIDLGHPAQLDDRRATPLLGEVLGAALRP